jgi:hypothetical protein
MTRAEPPSRSALLFIIFGLSPARCMSRVLAIDRVIVVVCRECTVLGVIFADAFIHRTAGWNKVLRDTKSGSPSFLVLLRGTVKDSQAKQIDVGSAIHLPF